MTRLNTWLPAQLSSRRMSGENDDAPEERTKRARNSRSTVGKVNWDDIELGSSEDEALPSTKRGRNTSSKDVAPGRSSQVGVVRVCSM